VEKRGGNGKGRQKEKEREDIRVGEERREGEVREKGRKFRSHNSFSNVGTYGPASSARGGLAKMAFNIALCIASRGETERNVFSSNRSSPISVLSCVALCCR